MHLSVLFTVGGIFNITMYVNVENIERYVLAVIALHNKDTECQALQK